MSRDQHRGPTLAVVECPNLDTIKTTTPALSEFPCIQVACNARDSHYQVCEPREPGEPMQVLILHTISFWTFRKLAISFFSDHDYNDVCSTNYKLLYSHGRRCCCYVRHLGGNLWLAGWPCNVVQHPAYGFMRGLL